MAFKMAKYNVTKNSTEFMDETTDCLNQLQQKQLIETNSNEMISISPISTFTLTPSTTTIATTTTTKTTTIATTTTTTKTTTTTTTTITRETDAVAVAATETETGSVTLALTAPIIMDNRKLDNPRRNSQLSKIKNGDQQKRVYKIVLTGGPCGGKTTGQSRLCTFFENLGWKVFRVPETATVLLSGGVKFSDLTEKEAYKFQENLIRTMVQIENTYFELGNSSKRNCLIICDRGVMDASAYISKEKWEKMLITNNWNPIEMRDNRYNQILHLVSAANGAAEFYTIEEHACRSEGLDLARELDYKAAAAWVGHPYFDVIDNSTDFETKMNRLIEAVCQKLGIDIGDRLLATSRKLKFLVSSLPPDSVFPPFQDFDVEHHYLQSCGPKVQARLRKRGQNNHWSYIHTIRRPNVHGQSRIEVKTQLTQRDYINLLAQRDDAHFTIYKKRRCFLVNNQYFQLDIYKEPTHPRCKGLILLETYSSLSGDALKNCLPTFLNIVKEVTGDPNYSMFNLSLKEDWSITNKFCHTLHSKDRCYRYSGPPSN